MSDTEQTIIKGTTAKSTNESRKKLVTNHHKIFIQKSYRKLFCLSEGSKKFESTLERDEG
jgi:hypothetical protein